jgi:endogenous inhibitor of DNA gyrase (YacG/DUF329 family)
MQPTFTISAFCSVRQARIDLFTWCRGAEAGIERAKSDAVRFKADKTLYDYQATPIAQVAA